MLDVLRAVAIARVILYHASGDPRWSWFAAIPVMFFVGGTLYAASLERRPPRQVLRQRLRRIVIPLWAWSAFVFVVYTVARAWNRVPIWGVPGFVVPISPAVGPGGTIGSGGDHDPLHWTWMALWYVNAYVIFMVVGAPLRRFHRRHPSALLAILAIPVVLSGALRVDALGVLTANLLFWCLGYSYHDRRDRLPSRRSLALTSGAAAMVGLGYAATVTGFDVTTTSSPFLNDAVGLAWICGLVALAPQIERLASWSIVSTTTGWIQRRAMTLYLWHPLGLVLIRWGLGGPSPGTLVARTALAVTLTAAVIVVMARLEDVAARRSAPGRRGTTVGPAEHRTRNHPGTRT